MKNMNQQRIPLRDVTRVSISEFRLLRASYDNLVKENTALSLKVTELSGQLKEKEPVMIIEDHNGHFLFEGDEYWFAHIVHNSWSVSHVYDLQPHHAVVVDSQNYKAFATLASADKYCDEMNKPKQIKVLFTECGNNYALVFENRMELYGGRELKYHINPEDTPKVMEAFNKLNGKTTNYEPSPEELSAMEMRKKWVIDDDMLRLFVQDNAIKVTDTTGRVNYVINGKVYILNDN